MHHHRQSRWMFRGSAVCLVGSLFVSDFSSGVAQANEKQRVLFDGRTLIGWRETAFQQNGAVEVENGLLIVRAGKPMSGLTRLDAFPKTNYEVTLEAKRIAGGDFFCGLTFPVGDEFCSLIVGGWGGGLVGLSSLDGRDASENETTIYDQFEDNRWYRIRLLVTDERIKAWIDDRRYVHVVRHDHEFSVRLEVQASRPFGISTYQTTAAFRNLQLRQIEAARAHPGSMHAELNIPYANTGDPKQQLDLIFPRQPRKSPLPVIVFIADSTDNASSGRGGGLAWLEPLVASGHYAGVTVSYRPLGDATWPNSIQDCRAALRWIRTHAEQYDLDSNRIGVMGYSTGGQLAALLGTGSGVQQLAGKERVAAGEPSGIRCVVNLAGPTDLTRLMPFRGLSAETARSASPASYVTPDDSPLLLIHGSGDEVVPFAHSVAFKKQLRAVGVAATLITVEGAGHDQIRPAIVQPSVAVFFDKHLRNRRDKVTGRGAR